VKTWTERSAAESNVNRANDNITFISVELTAALVERKRFGFVSHLFVSSSRASALCV
jgi:hypothetical protein